MTLSMGIHLGFNVKIWPKWLPLGQIWCQQNFLMSCMPCFSPYTRGKALLGVYVPVVEWTFQWYIIKSVPINNKKRYESDNMTCVEIGTFLYFGTFSPPHLSQRYETWFIRTKKSIIFPIKISLESKVR